MRAGAAEDAEIARHHEWLTGDDDDDRCPECGATDDEPCARGCPNARPMSYAMQQLADAEDEVSASIDFMHARADEAEDRWRGDLW